MSFRREDGHEGGLLRVAAGDEARVLPRLEVLGHRRGHDHQRREGVAVVRLELLGRLVELVGVPLEGARGAQVEVGVGHGLAELDLAVAVEVGLDVLGLELVLGAEHRGLDEEVQVARLLVGLALRRLDAEGHGVLGIAGVAAGVDDHVVVGERRGARDHALHLLVVRVGLAEVRLGLLDEGLDLVAVLLQQLLVVEVLRLGELVVLLRALVERVGVGGERLRVVGQVGLDRLEAGLVGGLAAVVLVFDSSSEPQAERTSRDRRVAPNALRIRVT